VIFVKKKLKIQSGSTGEIYIAKNAGKIKITGPEFTNSQKSKIKN
jgi:hypothetical protein